MELPTIIQGGMGAGVSGWRLARAVSTRGLLGVVSGTALDLICARRLQDGDEDGAVRRAFENFPRPDVAGRVLERFFVPGGRESGAAYRSKPLVGHDPSREVVELLVVANFVEVWLAKEGHDGPIAINYLDKIQAPLLPSLYGAMLAGVDVVTVGAGVPKAIPHAIEQLARGAGASVDLYVSRLSPDFKPALEFDPADLLGTPPLLARPKFLPIVSSAVLATKLARHSGPIDGFVIETPLAGGHNAPPRGWRRGDMAEEPFYSARDELDFEKLGKLDRPYWLAGSYGHPGGLEEATALGAHGIQVGTLFAFCDESGLTDAIKRRVIAEALTSGNRVFTDPAASPTGFPFKVLKLCGTNAEPDLAASRRRVCDLGYLREAYETQRGGVGWRCPSEPLGSWQSKGGSIDATEGRKCLCNGLMANIGMPQRRADGSEELALVTAGTDVTRLAEFLPDGATHYGAADVVRFLQGKTARIGRA